MVQQVKRGSGGSRKAKRVSKVPPLPNKYTKQLFLPSHSPSAWVEVEKSDAPPHPPSPAYRADRSTTYEDFTNTSTRTRYHSFNTPIADQYAYHAH
ncbi:hypothetical protein CBS101457_004782 [Exobasidium rhododendri]|nr:hypothetical protein CBS101457_004782 [Exobasidium rhododendri]